MSLMSDLGASSFFVLYNLHISLIQDQLPWAQLQFSTTHVWVYFIMAHTWTSYIEFSFSVVSHPCTSAYLTTSFIVAALGAAPFFNHLHMGLFDDQLDWVQPHFWTTYTWTYLKIRRSFISQPRIHWPD